MNEMTFKMVGSALISQALIAAGTMSAALSNSSGWLMVMTGCYKICLHCHSKFLAYASKCQLQLDITFFADLASYSSRIKKKKAEIHFSYRREHTSYENVEEAATIPRPLVATLCLCAVTATALMSSLNP